MGILDSLWGPRVASISPKEAYERMLADPRTVIVDVRQSAETQSGGPPGAVLIPLTEFSRRMSELPRDRPILTICRSSHRSPIAARQLKRAGYDVTDVSGGTMAWRKAGLPIVRSGGSAGAG